MPLFVISPRVLAVANHVVVAAFTNTPISKNNEPENAKCLLEIIQC